MTFTGLPAFLAGTGSFLYDPTPTPLSWRSLFGAWYAEDVIRLRTDPHAVPGFSGMNSAPGGTKAYRRASNYTYASDVISTQPKHWKIRCSPSIAPNSLPQPRIGLAWSPFGSKTVVSRRILACITIFKTRWATGPTKMPHSIRPIRLPPARLPTSNFRSIPLWAARVECPAGSRRRSTGHVYPKPSWAYSLRIERELSPNTSLSVGYVGSHGYHELIGVDANAPVPVVCPATPCPGNFPTTLNPLTNFPVYGALAGQPVPAGTYFINPGTAKPNKGLANTWTWFSEGTSSYNSLQLDLKRRFSQGPNDSRRLYMVEITG